MSQAAPFFVDRAKGGRASCKGCKGNCPGGELRIAKVVPSPYGENQSMKSWYHVDCFMNALLKQRPATKRIDSIDDIDNWDNISKEDQELLLKKINEMEKLYAEKNSGKYTAKVIKNQSMAPKNSTKPETVSKEKDILIDDNMFTTYINLCFNIARVDAYTEKTAVVNRFFTKGVNGDYFKGDLALWCKLLLPQVSKRVYNLKSKQLVKVFSKIFNIDHDDMLTHLEQGDVADTIQHFFSKSRTNIQPKTESNFSIQQIDEFLEELSKLTKEEEQIYHFKKIVRKCTLDDIKLLIRLIKGDLRINAGPKHILEGVHPDAYSVFQTSRDLAMVIKRILSQNTTVQHKDAIQKGIIAKLSLMTPVLPMLAEACKSVEMATKKCPNGMFSEIKYDGERVQVHKKGNEFKYYSRALKPVMAHKVSHFKDYLPQAFPKGVDLILDAEVLLVDVKTGKPLPFGTLGVHKQSKFSDASVCLFVFDCLYYNGEVLMDMPIRKRRKILHDNMVEVKNHVMFSEMELIEKPADLAKMIAKVLELGLEGLVLKDVESKYEPGKRHWLKVKKDYLFDGAMADTADLAVLGAWFGTGKKGGMMSVFLMGCLDKKRNKWVTVTKVHTGHDDNTLKRLQDELGPLMVKISQDYHKVPSWLDCNKGMVPDFVALDPKKQPVWEITGTELTKANLHTADGISVRFPRVTRIRDDKDWESATNLDELRHLYKTSKEKTDVSLLTKLAETASESDESPKKKTKESPSKLKTINSYFTVKESNRNKSDAESNLSSKNSSFDECDSKANIDKNDSKKKSKGKYDTVSPNSSSTTIDTSFDVDMKEESNDEKSTDSHLKKKSNIKRKRNIDNNSSDNTIDTDNDDRSINDESHSSDNKESNKAKKIKKNHTVPVEDVDDCVSERKSPKHEKLKKNENLNKSKDSNRLKIKCLPDDPLPDVFKDKIIGFYPDFISIPENERRNFERHWIAYGGIVNKSLKSTDVDYLIHNKKVIGFRKMQKLIKSSPSNVKHVTKDWLVKCINNVKLCDTMHFSVTVEP